MSTIDAGDFPIDPDIVDGTQLAEILNRLKLAIYSNHSNTTRPADITEGGIWTKYTAPSTYQVLIYDGVTDAPLTVAGLAKGTSFANPFDAAVTYNTGALIWDAATETLLSAKYPIASGGAFNPGDWNANAKVEGSFLHLDGGTVTGAVQFVGAVDFTNILKLSTLTPSRALGINASGNIAASSATVTELSYLSGVTSAIQTQFAGKVSTTTQVIAGTGLTGGGALSANRTLSIALASLPSVTTGTYAATRLVVTDGTLAGSEGRMSIAAMIAEANISEWPGVYTGTTQTNASFPIGTYLYWVSYSGSGQPINGAPNNGVYIVSGKPHYGTNNAAYGDPRVAIAGTWRFRGGPTDTQDGIIQRTA